MVLLWIIAGSAIAISAGGGLGLTSIYSPLKLQGKLYNALYVWSLLGLMVGIRATPDDWTMMPVFLWFVAVFISLLILKWRYPGVLQDQHEFKFK